MYKKMKSVSQVYQEHLNESDCEVELYNNILIIKFSGKLARIPSLKNQKIPGRNFISNETQGKLRAMTTLYQFRAAQSDIKQQYGKQEIYLQVIIGTGSKVDEDNGFAAIKDWLEPDGGRKWGIGVIQDDKYITGEARHARRIDLDSPITTILIRPYAEVRERVKLFTQQIGEI